MMANPKDDIEEFTPAIFRRASRAVADVAAYGYASRVLKGYSIDLLPDELVVTLDTFDGVRSIIKNFSASYAMLSVLGRGGTISIETLFLVELGRLLPRISS
jgi:hypothetical protein